MLGEQTRNLDVARVLKPSFLADFMIPDDASTNSRYGWALTTGDFDGNDRPDLAIGAPWRNFEEPIDAGAVAVLYAAEEPAPAEVFGNGFETP